jgi:hypothetical protein
MASRSRIVSCLLAGALLPIAAGADSVHLKNGQIFEGVEAVVSEDHVRIDLPIGSMRLPMSKVARIEEVDSTLGEYRAREFQLGRERRDAAGWLELAQWARSRDFEQGMTKAALIAARLDPELEALDPLMAQLDYLYDEGAREWVPYDDAMRRRGLVEDQGEWVTPDEKRERSQARTEVIAEAPRSRADDHLDKALDILAEAVAKPDEPSNTTVVVQPNMGWGGGFGFFPGFVPGAFVGPVLHEPGIHSALPFSLSGTFFSGDAQVTRTTTWNQMTLRQPGSLIPATTRYFK